MQFTKSILLLTVLSMTGFAAPPNRILVKPDNTHRIYLNGNVHPKARAEYDQGRVSPSLQLNHVTLHFKLSAAQQTDLEQLLKDQQDPSSPSYHQWLTPEQFGARFGVSDADLASTTAWLQSQGLTVTGTARAKNHITFDGPASSIENAFGTELHTYLVDGEKHFANASEPSIPAALQPVVGGIHGLNNFRLKAHLSMREVTPSDTTASGHHYIAPDDFAAIYDLQPLYAAGFNGAGQKLVIVGQTALQLTDLQQFRAAYNLPGGDPTVVAVPNAGTQGVNKNDLQEADLDLEWSSAVARNATIIYVYSPDVFTSMTYAVDQNLAPVVSMSYGACEAQTPNSQVTTMRALAQQANSQGITWFNASGDSGGADCASSSNSSSGAVLAVDFPASVPEVTGVGGTEFNEGTGAYWATTNNANSASALSYIPETSWNDSATDGSPSASGGGASTLFTKPSWQTGPGVPSDGARDVPDISLNASADHDGYDTIMSGKTYSSGGTSAPTPIFAGIAAILNQYLVQNGNLSAPGLGNINPNLYNLAQSSPGAFHDITTGDNIVSVTCTGRRCTTQTSSSVGFTAGAGYDQVTGLGSVDIYNLFQAWSGGNVSSRLTPQIQVSASSTNLSAGQATVLTATVSSSNGTTPTGTVTFVAGTTTLGSATLSGSGGTATATLTVGASQLTSGTNNITAEYSSDSQFNSAA
ncbi:MAG TPA: protease pro-enzyme activation domain-containing protein, partial [Bryobacteraceae bacterium]